MSERFAARLRRRLFERLLSFEMAFYDARASGDLVSRLTVDIAIMQTTLTDVIGQRGLRAMFEIVGSLATIIYINPKLAIISLAVSPLLSAAARALVMRSALLAKNVQVAVAATMVLASERLGASNTIKSYGQVREAGIRVLPCGAARSRRRGVCCVPVSSSSAMHVGKKDEVRAVPRPRQGPVVLAMKPLMAPSISRGHSGDTPCTLPWWFC